jgi:hypothetical protein
MGQDGMKVTVKGMGDGEGGE